MATKLTFRADANGRAFGVIVVRNGLATARVGRTVLKNTLLCHALLWMERQNPTPAAVKFQLVGPFNR